MTTVARQGQPRLAALVIRLHQRYCTALAVRLVWVLLIVNSLTLVYVAAFAR